LQDAGTRPQTTPEGDSNEASRYAPIGDYAAIGDCHGAALVSRGGSVDWCCLGRFDADPSFCRVLDANRGGFLSVKPRQAHTVTRGYLGDTNILETTFAAESGTVAVTDFMPVGRKPGSGTHDYVRLAAPRWLVRIVTCERGRVPIEIGYKPTVDFARRAAVLRTAPGRIACDDGVTLHHDLPDVTIAGDGAYAAVTLKAGDRHILVVKPTADAQPIDKVDALLAITRAFWEEWIAYCRYDGPYAEAVRRSALVLKLLTYAPSGAITAALTTSLPEEIGGSRNWDYRYCWLRDTAFVLYSLAAIGYGGEARDFSKFLGAACATTFPELRIMYGVGPEPELPEVTHDHLDGYRGSRPVRVGNGAFRQRQIDVYGEVLDWALIFKRLGGRIDRATRAMHRTFADFVAEHWHEPDQGLWEMRGPPLHHVHGKIMSWVALDRAIALIGHDPRWVAEREAIARAVKERGVDPDGGHLRQAFDRAGTDAALLMTPMCAFPLDAGTLEATVAAVERELRDGDVVYRYRTDDGLRGDEGAFLICSFWLVDALLLLDRGDEARALFERLVGLANDVGLYSEEVEPDSGTFLGNFPQAFSHLALIGSAIHLQLYEEGGVDALRGSHADRAMRSVEATLGWRAIWAAFKASRKVGRIFSSRRSVMPDDLGRPPSA